MATGENKWQRVVQWQGMTTSDNEWQRVVQEVAQRVSTSDNE